MKSFVKIAPILTLIAATSMPAQVLPGSGGGGAPAPQPSSSPATDSSPRSGGSSKKSGGNLLGDAVPFLDPGSETATWDGKMWNVSNNRLVKARFEVYLATPEADGAEDKAYRDLIKSILKLLAPTRQGGPDAAAAFALLPEAGDFHIDAGLCNTLANAISDMWMSKQSANDRRLANEAMLKRRKELEWNTEQGMADTSIGNSNSRAGAQGKGKGQQAQNDQQTVSLTLGRVSGYIKSIAEIEARMKMNEAAIGVSELTGKAQFQGLIAQFFLQRRFEHALMAARFYPLVFRDGDSTLQLEDDSDLKKMFSAGLGSPPTVSSIDSLASEAIRSVDEAVVAFQQLVSRKDYDSASNRLVEAFAIGEYLPRIRTLPMKVKLEVLDYVRDGNQLISAMEMRDYVLAEELVTKLRGMAKDFDYSKPLAAIETAKTVSDMKLNAAKAAAVRSDQAGVEENLRGAAEIWPTNPKLRELSTMIGENSDIQAQALLDLDRLLSQRNYRQIFNDQGRFLASAINDPARQEQLKEVLTTMNRINMVVHAAEEANKNGNSHGAWEAIEKEFEQFPDDPEITRLRSTLSVKASEFVSALERAKTNEERNQIGSSIAWYLKARRLYPPSEFARNGLQRLVTQLQNPTDQAPSSNEARDDGRY